MGLVNACLSRLPVRAVERAGWKLLRNSSPQWRAWSDLFVAPYHDWVTWNSGLNRGAEVLYALVRGLSPSLIVEIGSARGKSTCAMALACHHNRGGLVVSVDPHSVNDWNDTGARQSTDVFLRQRLDEYNLAQYVEVHVETSQQAAAAWNRPIDLLFVDGDHSYEGVSFDFHAFLPFMTPHSLVVFHDSAWEHEQPWEHHPHYREHPFEMGVPRLLDELTKQGYSSVTLPALPGLTVLDPRLSGFGFVEGRARVKAEEGHRPALVPPLVHPPA